MKRLLVAFVVLFASSGVFAQGAGNVSLPSSASGDYVGGGWSCRVILSLGTPSPPATIRRLELQCNGPDLRQYLAVAQTNGCPGGAPYPMRPYSAETIVSTVNFTSHAEGTLAATINTTGRAVSVVMTRVQAIASPAPYAGCGSVATEPKPIDNYCANYFGCW